MERFKYATAGGGVMRSNPWFWFSIVLAVLGVIFYAVMGLAHGAWTDVGVYSITVILVGFGGVGAWVASMGEDGAEA